MHMNPDLIRNEGVHCFASPLELNPITENYDTMTKDVTVEFLMFFTATYYLLNAVAIFGFIGVIATCCKSNGCLTIIKLVHGLLVFCLLVEFVYITIIRFKTRGKVCSGDFVELIED